MTICPACRAPSSLGSRFCAACGAPLPADPSVTRTTPADERMPVRVVPEAGPTPSVRGRFASGADGLGPGTMVAGRYRVVSLIGQGGMGEVYRADDLKLGQPVALKFLPVNVERDPARLERFVAEVRTARLISHPNVCRVYDIGEFGGRRFLSMEYIDGEDLRSLLRRIGRLPEDKGLQIARQVCAGLAAMHDRGVLHRDLKPANVMLDGAGRARLTDFGLATAMTDQATDEIAGTPAYMAPEQLAGGTLSAQTDLYALGLLLFELFTGERVHKTDQPAERREWRDAPRPASRTTTSGAHLDPAIARVIERCLEPDPSRRPASAITVGAWLPGGDPLAAALAAGETPSPQIVAAAGEQGALTLKVGIPLVAALVLLTGCVVWLNGHQLYTAIVPFPHSSEVLATKARETLGRLGYPEPPADSGVGFKVDDAYATWLNQHDSSRTRWKNLASVRPPPATFWYRASPQPLVPSAFLDGTPGVSLTPTDPPLVGPGMTYVELDFSGRLVALRVVLPEKEAPTPPTIPPDWSTLFVEAGFDIAAFRPVAPEWTAPAGADARAAWVGPGADASGGELRVEAAAHHGRAVFFRLVAPWTEPAGATASANGRVASLAFDVIVAGVIGLAILLAIRNARIGRADRQGATRLAIAMSLIVLTSAVLESHFTFSFGTDLATLVTVVSWAAFVGLMMWTSYAALEPYARRHWPHMLISWSRLLEGRWRDPLIGRDLLIGSVIGLVILLLHAVPNSLKTLPETAEYAWMGLGYFFGGLVQTPPFTLLTAFGFILLLVGLRIVLRTERVACIALVAVFGGIGALAGISALNLVIAVIQATILVLVATRFGLVTLFATLAVWNNVSGSGASLTPAAPLVGTTALDVIALLVPGVFGFYTSRARRSLAPSAWLDE
jgi:hypothetical protein